MAKSAMRQDKAIINLELTDGELNILRFLLRVGIDKANSVLADSYGMFVPMSEVEAIHSLRIKLKTCGLDE